jgi:hypothetical protein
MSESSADNAFIEEQAATLFALYENKAKLFRRWLIGVVALMTIVFALIFWPYTSFRGEEYRLERRLATLNDTLETAVDDEAAFAEQLEYFRSSSEEFYGFLQDVLQDASDARLEHREQFVGPLNAVTERGRRSYAYSRVSHLRNEMAAPLDEALTETAAVFGSWLAREVERWDADSDPTPNVFGEFRSFTNRYYYFIVEHFNDLSNRHFDLGRLVMDLQADVAATQADIDDTRLRIEEIAALQDISTPFGPLPIGVNDLIMIFPILLAVGFYVCVNSYCESLQIRQSFRDLRKSQDPRAFDDGYLAMIAPVWIDPLRAPRHRLIRMLVLVSPLVLFAVSIGLLLWNALLWGDFMDEVRLSAWAYYAAYLISVVLFLEGGRRVVVELQRHLEHEQQA